MITSETKSRIRTVIGLASLIFVLTVTISIPISQATTSSQPNVPQPRPVPPSQPATGGPAGTYFDHLVFIIMENEGIADICGGSPPPCSGGSNTPYMAALANQYGIDKQYLRVGAGTSQPQYIALMAASQMNCTSGCGTTGNLHALNLVDRLESAGLSWKAYMEDQGVAAGCVSSDNGFYAAIHNPFVSFNDIFTSSARCNNIVLANPSGCGSTTDCALINDLNSGSAPNFMWLTPNNCDNMHAQSGCPNGCTSPFTSGCLKAGDNYLKSVANNILNSTTFKTTNSALYITFDEGNGFCPGGFPSGEDCMYNVWSGPAAKTAYFNSTLFNHYSFAKTIETNWGLSTMTSNDASATPMTSFLKLQTGPDFSISASPTSINALAGAQGTSTITLNSLNSFTGTVSLAVSSSPTGPTLNLNPTSVTLTSGGTGISTLTVASSTSGNYTVTVTGASGSLQHSTTVSVHVQDYSITASPTNIKTNAGTSGTSTITVAPINHFAGTVSLSVTGTTGLTTTISPTTISGGSGTATLTASSPTVGNYTATVTSTSGSLTHTVSVTVQVVDFTISASQPSPVNAGASASSTITVSAVNHFTGTVSLTDTVPSGLSCGTISPSSITGSGTATVLCSATIAGNYTLTITGTSSSLVHTATVLFQVRDFTIASSSVVVNSGTSGTSTITVTALNKFAGTVTLTDTIPSGLVCSSITPSSLSGSGSATIPCSAAVSGNYTLTITGTSGSLIHTATALFQVQNFGIAASSPSPANAGSSATSTITISAINQFAGLVSLTDTIPSGLTCGVITPNSVSGSGTATVSCSAASAGNYTLTLTGTSSSLIHTATALFQFRDFTIAASSPAPVNAGSSASSTITIVALNHFVGVVGLTDTVPSGLACGTITPGTITGSGTATVSCSASLAGNYTLTIIGTSVSLVHNATAIFRFQNFTISASSPAPINAASSTSSTITILSVNEFAGLVSISDTVPSGLTCGAIAPTSVTGSGTATVSCTSTVAGNYTLTVTGTSGSLVHSATALFQFRDFTTSATTPGAVDATQTATSNITITSLNHFNGLVNLTDTVPPGLTCGAMTPASVTGAGAATVSCSATVAGNFTLTLTGSSGTLVHSATVILRFQDFTITATSPVAVNASQSPTSTVTIAATNGFAGTVSFSTTTPPGLSCGSFSPPIVTGSGSSTISCSATVAGNYTATITGTSTPLIHNATATFQFRDFTIAATSPVPVNAGNSATSTITVAPLNHFAGTVSLTDTVPSGLTCGTIAPSTVTGSGTATVSCSATVAGNYTLTITGTSSSLVHSATATFRFQNFIISASSPSPVNAGLSATSTITLNSVNGFAGVVTLTDTTPSGLTCGTITPGTITGSGTATVSCSATVAGTYALTVSGTSGALVHSANATFTFVDFAIAASSPAAVNAGQSATSTITISAVNAFAGVVSLTSTPPAGLSCGPPTPGTLTGSGTASISCNATVAGTYVLTVTGTSGTLVHTATAAFNFVDFTIAASSPAPLNAGSSANSTITVAAVNGFAGAVSLSDFVPSGLTCGTIAPASITGSGTASVSCSATIAGNYTLTVTGTAGSLFHSASALLQFRDFIIVASSSTAANVGVSTTSTITVTGVNHFSGTVLLSDTVPAGLACGTISPVSVTGSGNATVSCSASVAGNYTLILTGTSGSLVHAKTTVFQFWDFSTSASSPAPVNAGASAISIITITVANHFNGVVSLSDSVPSGLVCGTVNPTSVAGSGTATISCNATVAGNYTLTVTGTSGALVHNATVLFQFQDFGIASSTPTPANTGSSATVTITIVSINRFAGGVNLTDIIPSGLSCGAINPASLTGSGTATVSCNGTAAGNYTLTVVGVSGSLNHSSTALFRVQDFGISATSPAQVNAGVSAASTITVTAVNGFTGVVSLNDNVPTGLTCNTINPSSVTSSGNAVVSCTSNVAGNYTLTVTGTNGALSHSATVLVSTQDFSISASPTSVMINAGSSSSSMITITALNHFSGPVSLSVSGTAGLTSSVSPTSLPGGSGTATLTFSSSTAGNYTETLASSSGTLTHTITVGVQVVDFAVAASPSTITILAGASGNSTITVTAMNGFSATVNLVLTPSRGLTAATAPTSISGSGLSAMSVSASTSGDYLVTMRASSGSLSHTVVLVIHVMDYSLAGNPVNPVAPIGSNTSSTLNVQSLNNYAGNLTVTFTVQADPGTSSGSSGAGGGRPGLRMAPPGPVLPIISINPQSFQLSSGGTQQSAVSISLPSNLPSGNYIITLTASDGILSHQITLTLVATDFRLNGTPNSSTIQAGSNTTITLSLQSMNFFQGNVTLTVGSSGGGITGALSTSTVQLTFDRNVNLNLTIHVPSNTAAGNYTITVQALSGTVSHSLSIPVTVTSGGFGTILSEMLSPHNSTSIGATVLITLLAIFATLKIQTYQEHKPTLEQRRRIENRLLRRNVTGRLLPYSFNLPLLWRSTSRDEF